MHVEEKYNDIAGNCPLETSKFTRLQEPHSRLELGTQERVVWDQKRTLEEGGELKAEEVCRVE